MRERDVGEKGKRKEEEEKKKKVFWRRGRKRLEKASEGCQSAWLAHALERSSGSFRPLFPPFLPNIMQPRSSSWHPGKSAKERAEKEGGIGVQRGAMVWRSLVFFSFLTRPLGRRPRFSFSF